MSFKENLEKIRNERNISEEDMSKELFCTLEEFKDLETGKREPKLQEIIAIAKTLAVSTDKLLGNEAEKEELKSSFDPLSLLSGFALPGGFSISPDDGSDYDEEDEKLALELAEMVSSIDTRRTRIDTRE